MSLPGLVACVVLFSQLMHSQRRSDTLGAETPVGHPTTAAARHEARHRLHNSSL